MYQTITESTFVRAIQDVRPEHFSLPALRALFQHLEELELDPIAICCDWAEYSASELLREYGYPGDNLEDNLEHTIEYIREDGGEVLIVQHAEYDTYVVRAC